MFYFTFLLLMVGAVLGDESSKNDGRIVGGILGEITDAPYQVSLNSYAFGHFCGGSIIGKKWILTAAHCTDSYKHQAIPLLRIRAGTSKRLSGGEVINVKKIYQHAQFHMKTVDYDFALLELAKDITFDRYKRAVTLPRSNQPVTEGSVCTVTGWGLTKNKQESNNHLRVTKVPVTNQEKCKQAYKGLGTVTDRMFCAGYPAGGKDACQGDSGGPLVHNNVQIGVVSWGHGCAKAGYPGIYARIASVRNWIKDISGI